MRRQNGKSYDRIVAIDPDTKRPGYSVFNRGKLEEHGIIPYRNGPATMRDAFPWFMDTLAERADALIIEDQFIPPGKTERAKSIISLAVSRGKLEIFFEMKRVRICRVMGYRWQNEVLTSGRGRGKRSLKRSDAKAASIRVASEIAGTEIKNPDVADAICIGSFFARLYSIHGNLAFDIASDTKKREKRIRVIKRAR